MSRAAVLALLLPFWSGVTVAAHSYGGMDLCTTYPEKMPPGIFEVAQLPQTPTGGAELMQRYCEQCHYLPGPGRHTAAEWPALLKQMNLLMDVSNRFGNLMGKIETPTASEREIIQNYLVNNALQPLEPIPDVLKGHAFERHCASCHALPDPKQHTAAEWSQVVERMLRSMTVMKYSPPDAEELKAIKAYLQSGVVARHPAAKSVEAVSKTVAANSELSESSESIEERSSTSGSVLALGPFILLALVGIWRWYFSRTNRRVQ